MLDRAAKALKQYRREYFDMLTEYLEWVLLAKSTVYGYRTEKFSTLEIVN